VAGAPNGKTRETSGEVDPAKVVLAQKMSKHLIDCDPAILSFIVVDELGRVLHVARSTRLPIGEEVGAEQVKAFGTIAKIIIGSANQAAPMMGATELVIGVFKNQKVLLINLPEYGMLLGIRLARSASGEYVAERIRGLLATTGEA
jgi:hypothetical protein